MNLNSDFGARCATAFTRVRARKGCSPTDEPTGFFTVYDGAFDKYIMDFTRNIGEVVQEFIDFAAAASRALIGFYQAYPGLSNQDIRALIADSKAGQTP